MVRLGSVNTKALHEQLRRWILPLFILLTIGVICICGLMLTKYGPPDFDSWMLLWFRTRGESPRLAEPVWGTSFWLGITSLGNTAPRLAVAGATIIALLLLRRRQSALFVAGVLLSSIALSTMVKLSVERPRPQLVLPLDQASLGSFPSGHALNSMVFYMLVALIFAHYLRHRAARLSLYGIGVSLSLAVGLSRIALGVHYPSDVVAGWLIGAAWLSLWVIIGKRFWPKVFSKRLVRKNP